MDIETKLDKTADLFTDAIDVITGLSDLIAPTELSEYTRRIMELNDRVRRVREEIQYGTND